MFHILKIILLVFSAGILFESSVIAADFLNFQPVPTSDQRNTLVLELYKQDFFKNATCKEVMDTMLINTELPEIGANKLLRGVRENFDRSKADQDPPILSDGIEFDKNLNVKLNSVKDGASVWKIRLSRRMRKNQRIVNELDSVFWFSIEANHGRQRCELSKLSFALSAGSSMKDVSMDQCLNLALMKTAVGSIQGNQISVEKLDWIGKDCSFALHYSKDVKSSLQPSDKTPGK